MWVVKASSSPKVIYVAYIPIMFARHDGKHGYFRHVLVFFFFSCFTCAVFFFFFFFFFYKHSTNNAQTSNKYVGRKGIDLNCHGLLCAEMAIGRIDQRLLFAAKIFDSQ